MNDYDEMDDSAGYADSLTDVGFFMAALLAVAVLAVLVWMML